MEDMYNKIMEEINSLDKTELEQHLIVQKALPLSNERIFSIAYTLLKLERLAEAFSFFEKIWECDIEKCRILLTGYYKGFDGNWHDYDDSCGGDGGGDNNRKPDDGCVEGCAYICACSGCVGCIHWCGNGGSGMMLDCICKFCC